MLMPSIKFLYSSIQTDVWANLTGCQSLAKAAMGEVNHRSMCEWGFCLHETHSAVTVSLFCLCSNSGKMCLVSHHLANPRKLRFASTEATHLSYPGTLLFPFPVLLLWGDISWMTVMSFYEVQLMWTLGQKLTHGSLTSSLDGCEAIGLMKWEFTDIKFKCNKCWRLLYGHILYWQMTCPRSGVRARHPSSSKSVIKKIKWIYPTCLWTTDSLCTIAWVRPVLYMIETVIVKVHFMCSHPLILFSCVPSLSCTH